MNTNKTQPTGSLRRMVRALDELQKRVEGREIEMHSQPRSMPVRYRNSVYVRGDERDGYSTCVASGHGGTMAAALRQAISQWAKRPNDPSSPTANSNAPEQDAEKSRSVQCMVRRFERYTLKNGLPILRIHESDGKQWVQTDFETLNNRKPTEKLRRALAPLLLWCEKTLLRIGYRLPGKLCADTQSRRPFEERSENPSVWDSHPQAR